MTSSRSCNMGLICFRHIVSVGLAVYMDAFEVCLRNGCISLTVSPEFFGNRFGDFIGCPFIWRKI